MRSILLVLVSLALSTPATAQSAAAIAYTPTVSKCPEGFQFIRKVDAERQTLNVDEADYVAKRLKHVLPGAWKSYLKSVEGTSSACDLPSYVSDILNGKHGAEGQPRFSIATSGGGYRAAFFGAAVLNLLDGRNASSLKFGTGGLLQASTYLSSLSGGAWQTISAAQANNPMMYDLIFGPTSTSESGSGESTGWLTSLDILAPSSNTTVDEEYFVALAEEVKGKADAGFPVSLADMWARALSRHFVNGTTSANFMDENVTHGAGKLFSDLIELPSFTSHQMPYLISLSDSLSANQNTSNIFNSTADVVPLSNIIYEMTMHEFGSYDPGLSAFTSMRYLGSRNDSICTTGFDQICFIEGLTSELLNEELGSASSEAAIEILTDIIPGVNITTVGLGVLPNSFYGVSPTTYIDSGEEQLTLIDGGEDGQVVAIQPLLVKARDVEVILAIDTTNDTANGFAGGSSLSATQQRVKMFPKAYSFPPVPPTLAEFLADNLTMMGPTFFGCQNSSMDTPLVIYLPNGAPPPGQQAFTNTSTTQLSFIPEEVVAFLDQAADIASQGRRVDGAPDRDWPVCLACAVVDRARERLWYERSGICEKCMERYCWS